MLNGRCCSVDRCPQLTMNKSSVSCKYHTLTEGMLTEDFGTKDPECDELDDDQKKSLHDQMTPALTYWISKVKNIPSARIYVGGSKYSGHFRAENDAHYKDKPLGFSVGEIIKCKSVTSVREAEHHAIKIIMEECGENKMLNLTGGGGGFQEDDYESIDLYYIYCLFYINNEEAIVKSKFKKHNDLSIKICHELKENLHLIEREVGFLLGAPLCHNINATTHAKLKFAELFGYTTKPL